MPETTHTPAGEAEDGPDRRTGPYRVVVGVSTTSGSPMALRWAARQAEAFGGEVVAVRAWKMPKLPTTVPTVGTVPNVGEMRLEAERGLAEAVADALGADAPVRKIVVQGGRRKALLSACREADLLVVDAPRSLRARPFASRLVYAASCPVVVMPPRISGEERTRVARAAETAGRSALRGAGTAGRPGYRPR